MTPTLETLFGETAAMPPLAWLGVAVVGILLLRSLLHMLQGFREIEIRGLISGIDRANVVEVNVGSRRAASPGQVFTVYKRLTMGQFHDGSTYADRVIYTPVGLLKVLSTTHTTSLCKFRPIEGYSNGPSLGDTVYFSNRVPEGRVAPLPTA